MYIVCCTFLLFLAHCASALEILQIKEPCIHTFQYLNSWKVMKTHRFFFSIGLEHFIFSTFSNFQVSTHCNMEVKVFAYLISLKTWLRQQTASYIIRMHLTFQKVGTLSWKIFACGYTHNTLCIYYKMR